MEKRRSIKVEGFSHGQQPIPAAYKVGPLFKSGGSYGLGISKGRIPDGINEQIQLMFENLSRFLAAAGAALDYVVKFIVCVCNITGCGASNAGWIRIFPDVSSRPAHHAQINNQLPGKMFVQCDFTADCG